MSAHAWTGPLRDVHCSRCGVWRSLVSEGQPCPSPQFPQARGLEECGGPTRVPVSIPGPHDFMRGPDGNCATCGREHAKSVSIATGAGVPRCCGPVVHLENRAGWVCTGCAKVLPYDIPVGISAPAAMGTCRGCGQHAHLEQCDDEGFARWRCAGCAGKRRTPAVIQPPLCAISDCNREAKVPMGLWMPWGHLMFKVCAPHAREMGGTRPRPEDLRPAREDALLDAVREASQRVFSKDEPRPVLPPLCHGQMEQTKPEEDGAWTCAKCDSWLYASVVREAGARGVRYEKKAGDVRYFHEVPMPRGDS